CSVSKSPDAPDAPARDSLGFGVTLEYAAVFEFNQIIALRLRIGTQLIDPFQILAGILKLSESVAEDSMLVLSGEDRLGHLPHLDEFLIVGDYFALGVDHQNAIRRGFERSPDDLGLAPDATSQDGYPAKRSRNGRRQNSQYRQGPVARK